MISSAPNIGRRLRDIIASTNLGKTSFEKKRRLPSFSQFLARDKKDPAGRLAESKRLLSGRFAEALVADDIIDMARLAIPVSASEEEAQNAIDGFANAIADFTSDGDVIAFAVVMRPTDDLGARRVTVERPVEPENPRLQQSRPQAGNPRH